jgi:hypothetical protein
MHDSLTEFIKTDQFGYLPDAQKIAVISNPVNGFNASQSFAPGSTYKVRRVSDGAEVYSGTLFSWNNGNTHGQSGDQVWWFDFSALTTPGEYYISDPANNAASHPFSIGTDVYKDVLKQAVRTFYYQRCGTAKETPYAAAEWTDVSCHLGAEQDRDCRLVTAPSASNAKDLSGGWHDAGDYNKYINYADVAVHDLLSAYEENPSVWGDDYNIPESGNGIPDLLDEIKWELDWMLKMQLPDGSVLHKVSAVNWDDAESPPSHESTVRRYAPATASATINACGVFAHAAVVFESLPVPAMQAYGEVLKQAAIAAWNWIDTHPSDIPSAYDNAGFVNAAAEDEEYTQYANIISASAYLLVLTGNTDYRTYFDNHYTYTHLFDWNGVSYNFKDPQIQDALLYYAHSPLATASVVTAIRNKYLSGMANQYNDFYPLKAYNDSTDAYRAWLDEYLWGSNSYKGNTGSMFSNLWVYDIDPANNPDYRDAATGYLHYLHGVNPMSLVYLSNMGDFDADNSVPEFYHMWFADGTDFDNVNTSLYGPAPGFLVGGPNPTYTSPGSTTIEPPENQPDQKSYKSWNTVADNSWEVTENQDLYQAAYVKLLSKFVGSANTPLSTTYFVSTAGDDNDPGTFTQPWRTIQKACNSATPGSTVYITGGTYNEKVTVNVSGTPDNPITFTNYAGQEVIVDGNGISGSTLLDITDKSYLVFSGLYFKNCIGNYSVGILVTGTSHHIELRNNKISDIHFSSDPNAPVNSNTNSQPLIVYGTSIAVAVNNVIIDGNEVFDSRTGFSEGLAVNGNVDGFEITNNTVHDITNIGIDMIGHEGTCSEPDLDQARNGICRGNTVYNCSSDYATAAGIYVDGAKDIVIERNKVYQNQWGIEIGCENVGKTTSGITVKNNLIYNNSSSGITAGGYDYPSGSGKVVDCGFYNNTCYHNDTDNTYNGELTMTYTENCVFKNNIFNATAQNLLLALDVTPLNLVLNYNLYECPAGSANAEVYWDGTDYTGFANYVAGTSQDQQSKFGSPAFVDNTLPTPDLHLQNTSMALENGTDLSSVGVTEDYDGNARPKGNCYDIGAYEYVFSTSLLISEVADPANNQNARFVELYNTGSALLDFSTETWYLSVQSGGAAWHDIALSGTVDAGETFVVAYGGDFTNFNAAYGFDPDMASMLITGDGDDGYFLYLSGDHATGTLIDAYGVPDTDGTGTEWEYTDMRAVRKYAVVTPDNVWHSQEWIIRPQADVAGMTPDFHREAITWQGTTSSDWNVRGDNWNSPHGFPPDETADVTVPDVTNDPVISGSAVSHDITVGAGAVLTLASTGKLTVEGDLENIAGAPGFIIESDAAGTGSLITKGAVTGSITAKRYFTGYGSGSNQWHLLSSPVTGQSITPGFVNSVSPDPDNDFYYWDEPTAMWINSKAEGGAWNNAFDDTFAEGKGYLVSYKVNTTKTFTGIPGNGTFATGENNMPAITFNTGEGEGWTLLGNPYPSAIDWDLLTKSGNINGSVYVMDGTNGQYITWNGTVGALAGGEIPPAQGFFVKAEAAGQKVTIENDDRLHTTNPFYKSHGNVPNLLTLTVTGNGHSDKTYLHFRWDASGGYDMRYDTYKLFGAEGAPQLYSVIAGEMEAAVNTMPLSETPFDVPLHFRCGAQGDYSLAAEGFESFNGTVVYLEDLVTGEIRELNKNPVYAFTAKPGDDPTRFVLHFNGVNSAGEQDETMSGNHIEIFVFGNRLTVTSTTGDLPDGRVELFSMQGECVFADRIENVTEYRKTVGLLPGFYIARYVGPQQVVTRKVRIGKK